MERMKSGLHKTDFAGLLERTSHLSIILIAIIMVIWALDFAEVIAAPLVLAIVIGLMVTPAVRFFERLGLSSWLAAGIVVIVLLGAIMAMVFGFAVPVSTWVDKAPKIWHALQLRISDWRAALSSLNDIKNSLSEIAGQAGHMTVTVDDSPGVATVVTLAPAYLAEVMLFLISLYFFLATREDFRATVLSICITRRLRWRAARVFRDAEKMMSRYLLSITIINLGLGTSVGLALWAAGTPSPMLWGMMAAVLNYIVYVGPAVMVAVLFSISLATNDGMVAILIPPAIYMGLNLIESQFITTRVLGASMAINPFIVFISLTFWLWLWGPIGGFIAVPSLLVGQAIFTNVIPAMFQPASGYSRIR
jgi:predicted PurR-regulated permease PerM